jgi:S-methylmethionine-dependent homocysteine/selenocysteine methylase
MAQSTGKQPLNIIFPPQNSASNSLFSPKTSGDYGEAGTLEFLKEAREVFLKEHSNQSPPVQRPILVAASIGSYGAYLADGSEYR